MERPFDARDAHARVRLRRLTEGVADEARRCPVADDWTVTAAFAHFAFWDRSVEECWDRYARASAIDELPDGIVDIANPAGLPG